MLISVEILQICGTAKKIGLYADISINTVCKNYNRFDIITLILS